MKRFRLRPRFEQVVSLQPEAIQDKISSYFTNKFGSFEVKRFPGFTCIRIPEGDRHYWSPRLNLSFTEDEESGTLIQGYYGPNASVWGLLLYGYLLLGFAGMIAGIVAMVQYSIGGDLWTFWIFAGAVIGIVLLYLVARTGRTIGERQVLRLHRAFEKAIGESISIR